MTETAESVKRCCDRIFVSIPVEIVVESSGNQISYLASTVDFSTHGARVKTMVPLVPGEHVSFVWPAATPRPLRGTVVWAASGRPSQDREAGLQFLQPLQTAL